MGALLAQQEFTKIQMEQEQSDNDDSDDEENYYESEVN